MKGFTASSDGSGLHLVGANAELFAPVGATGVTLTFDGTSRQVLLDMSQDRMLIGSQVITPDPAPLAFG